MAFTQLLQRRHGQNRIRLAFHAAMAHRNFGCRLDLLSHQKEKQVQESFHDIFAYTNSRQSRPKSQGQSFETEF